MRGNLIGNTLRETAPFGTNAPPEPGWLRSCWGGRVENCELCKRICVTPIFRRRRDTHGWRKRSWRKLSACSRGLKRRGF